MPDVQDVKCHVKMYDSAGTILYRRLARPETT